MLISSIPRSLLLVGVLLLIGGSVARGQGVEDIGVYRDTIDVFQPQPYSLRPFVLPGSERIWVGGTRLDSSEYRLDPRRGALWVERRDLIEQSDTLIAAYRTYPFAFRPVYRRRAPDSTAQADSAGAVAIVEEESSTDPGFDPFEGVTLERSGSISRGVVGGSNRDATIESGLRMQLQGNLAEDVRVRAVLTDQNTPLQPQGTTQRLDEFDRVFLELETPQGTAQLGDVEVAFQGTQFAQFSRRLQGAQLQSSLLGPTAGIAEGRATAVGAVSRGIYRKQDVQPIDGVQGPYRLTGRNGEELIVIVAGSERVFLDGERLTRGRTNDYVIDYARGDVTFTANRLITDERRITVEFQYTTTQFTRSVLGAEAKAGFWARDDGTARASFGATVLREADGDNFQAAFDLSEQDSLRLAQSGDAPVSRTAAQPVAFDPEAPFVQYRREVRSGPDGAADTVFVALDRAPEEGETVFRVRFSRVGTGQGDYTRGARSVNGIAYEYVGPGNGDYAPTEPLPKPRQQRLVDLTGEVEPLPGLAAFGEWAQSLNDLNRLSSRDAADDRDRAYTAGLRLAPTPLNLGRWDAGRIGGEIRREVRGRHFETFDPTRPIEFGRRWNLSRSGSDLGRSLEDAGDETVDEGTVRFAFGDGSALEGGAGRLAVGKAFEAWRREGRMQLQEAGLPRLDARLESVTSTDRVAAPGTVDGTWLRQRATLRQPLWDGRLEPSVAVEREVRRQNVTARDSLTRASFAFWEVRPGLAFRTGAWTAEGSVEYREEDGVLDRALTDAATGWTAQTTLAVQPEGDWDARVQGGYRVREVRRAFQVEQGRRDTESVLLQMDAGVRPWDRAVSARFFYDGLTERTPTDQELYIRTGPELGQFVWTDVNEDGIQQVDEFVPETTPNEGTYVQTFVPSDSLESVVRVESRLRVELDPGRVWRTAGAWWKRAASAVTTRTTIEVREQSRTPSIADVYLLKLGRFREPGTTLNGRLRLEQGVTLFRQRPGVGLDVEWAQARGLSDRAAGTERTFVNAWTATARWRPADRWGLRMRGSVERDRTESEAFADTRSFAIDAWEARPEVTYRPRPTLRLALAAAVSRKDEALQNRRAQVVKVPLEVEWSRAGRFQATGTLEAAQVDLTGEAAGLAQFELTDGRGTGRSYLWGLQGRYVVSRFLRATVAYDGRAPAGAPTIHTFRAQVSATF